MADEKKLSRREFLYGSGGFAAGVAIGTGGLGMLSGCLSPQVEVKCPEATKCPETTKIDWPWPYEKVDPTQAADIAYENWYVGYCCYATASGILEPLQESVGEPYASFPLEAVRWGHGGAVGWGTLCGTLTGAGIATGLIAGANGELILNDVIEWYSKTELPIYEPADPKATFETVNKSNSPLCHISVGKWMEKEDVAFRSAERKDRCARLSADVASKTVELLNQWKDGTYTATAGSQLQKHDITTQSNCMDCHGVDIPTAKKLETV